MNTGTWSKHGNSWIAEASELIGPYADREAYNTGRRFCPCGQAFTMRQMKAMLEDGEVVQWRLKCTACDSWLVIFND